MNKLYTFQILTIIAIMGMICWNITDYYGGMIIHLFQYWYLIIPIFILYIISLLKTIGKISKNGIKSNQIISGAHILFLVFILSSNIIESDLLKSKRVLTGTLKDDLVLYTLIFREDGTCENNLIGFLGYKKKYEGTYFMKGDTIIFTKKPYDNNFIPDTLLLDKAQKAIFLNTDKSGEFNTTKEWLNYFKVK